MASERSREGDGILPVRAEATVVDESIREQKGFALPSRHVDLVNGFGARGTQPSIAFHAAEEKRAAPCVPTLPRPHSRRSPAQRRNKSVIGVHVLLLLLFLSYVSIFIYSY